MVIGAAVTLPFVAAGVIWIVEVANPAELSGEAKRLLVLAGVPALSAEANRLSLIAAVLVLAGSAVAVLALVGVAMRRRWGREAAMGVFGLYAAITVPLSLAGMAAEPPGKNAWIGLLVGIGCAAVLSLLLIPSTAALFEHAEMARTRPGKERTVDDTSTGRRH